MLLSRHPTCLAGLLPWASSKLARVGENEEKEAGDGEEEGGEVGDGEEWEGEKRSSVLYKFTILY